MPQGRPVQAPEPEPPLIPQNRTRPHNTSPTSNAHALTQPPQSPAPSSQASRVASRIAQVIAGHLGPFSRSVPLNERRLRPLLEQACHPQGTPDERIARFDAIFDQLPARNEASGPLHALCLQAILTLIDPVERRDLFLHYGRRHRFPVQINPKPRFIDPTPHLFELVSDLQKPEHRSTRYTWKSLRRVWSPDPSTSWPVWRGLCRVLATQMAELIPAFQQSRESQKNKRDFNELVLRAVQRLAAPADGDAATTLTRQFELLSDLAQALAPKHRSSSLHLLEEACAGWIEQEMKNWHKEPVAELETELGLLAALRLLGERYGDPAQGPSVVRLDDNRAESAVQGFVDQLKKGQRPQGAAKL